MTNNRTLTDRRKAGFTLVEIMIVVLIIGILLNIAAPSLITARNTSRAKACIANLKQLDSAKQQYILDNKASSTFAFSSDTSTSMPDLSPTYIRKVPVCPGGGAYTVGAATTNPTCSYAGADGAHILT